MPAWNDERMAWGERESVGECGSESILREELSCNDPCDKHGSIITT